MTLSENEQTAVQQGRADELIGLTTDDLLKRFGKTLAKDRFTLANVQTDASDGTKGPNPLRQRLPEHLGWTIPDADTEVIGFHWKGAAGTDEDTYTGVWMLKQKAVRTSFDALCWQ